MFKFSEKSNKNKCLQKIFLDFSPVSCYTERVDKLEDMKNCKHCGNRGIRKKGTMKTKRGSAQRYQCKACLKTFTDRTGSLNYRKRKQELRKKISQMYCERMSLRGISRTLGISINTVTKYFRESADRASIKNKKRIAQGGLVTRFMQFDQLETYEHTKRRPVGIQVSIRHKTGEIISAKAGFIPIRALTVSKAYSEKWNKRASKSSHVFEMLWESRKALDETGALVSCDRDNKQVYLLKQLYTAPQLTLSPSSAENKRIDRVFRRMRQDISRLGRKTLSTTKRLKNLQRHLDLYTDYANFHRIS